MDWPTAAVIITATASVGGPATVALLKLRPGRNGAGFVPGNGSGVTELVCEARRERIIERIETMERNLTGQFQQLREDVHDVFEKLDRKADK